MAILVLTFTHTLDAQAANLADAATAQLPDSCASGSSCVTSVSAQLLPLLYKCS